MTIKMSLLLFHSDDNRICYHTKRWLIYRTNKVSTAIKFVMHEEMILKLNFVLMIKSLLIWNRWKFSLEIYDDWKYNSETNNFFIDGIITIDHHWSSTLKFVKEN